MTAFADVKEHAWGFSWSKLAVDRDGDRLHVIHDTVVITKYGSGYYCWRCRQMSELHPCEHVCDALAHRNRTRGDDGALDSPEAA